MATFSDMHNYVLPYLPGAEVGIVNFHLRRALREFFKRTTIWREVFTTNTVAGTPTYTLTPPNGIVSSILSVHLDERPIDSVPEDRRNPFIASRKPDGWYNLLPQVISLYPTPDAVYPVRVEAAITLDVEGASDFFPDNVFAEYAEPMAAGAISAMMLMPGKPWTQRESGAMYSRIFGSAIRELRGQLRDGGQPNQSTFIAARRFGV